MRKQQIIALGMSVLLFCACAQRSGSALSPSAQPTSAAPVSSEAPAASEPAASEPAVPEPAVPEPATSEPAASEPAVPEPAVPEPATSEPAASEPVPSAPEASSEAAPAAEAVPQEPPALPPAEESEPPQEPAEAPAQEEPPQPEIPDAPAQAESPASWEGGGTIIRQLLELTNAERGWRELPPLRLNEALCALAELRAREASERWSHERPDGSLWATVLQENGVSYAEAGENLFCANLLSAQLAVENWMDSPTHRDNLLHASFTELGLGVFEGEDGYWYYTQIFLTP